MPIFLQPARYLVVSVEADTMERLKEVIGSEIRRLENVRSTLTMIVVE